MNEEEQAKLDGIFASSMLQYLAQKYRAPVCENMTVKVIRIQDERRWLEFYTKCAKKLEMSDVEYTEAERDGSQVDGLSQQWYVPRRDGTKCKYEIATDPLERKEAATKIFGEFDADLPDALTPYDATIFLNNERLESLSADDGEPYTAHRVMTHECINLFEERANRAIIVGHDPSQFMDEASDEAFYEYVQKIGGKERFEERYNVRY